MRNIETEQKNSALVDMVAAEVSKNLPGWTWKKGGVWKAEGEWVKGDAHIQLCVLGSRSHIYTPVYVKEDFRLRPKQSGKVIQLALRNFEKAVSLATDAERKVVAEREKGTRRQGIRNRIVEALLGGREPNDIEEYHATQAKIKRDGDDCYLVTLEDSGSFGGSKTVRKIRVNAETGEVLEQVNTVVTVIQVGEHINNFFEKRAAQTAQG